MPAASMVRVMMNSAAGLSKKATLAFRVENPQVLQADIAWVAASNQPNPVSFSDRKETTVRAR